MEQLCSLLNDCRDTLNDIRYVSSHPDEFESVDFQGLQSQANKVVSTYKRLMTQLESYINNPSLAVPISELFSRPSLPARIPELPFSISGQTSKFQPAHITLQPGEKLLVNYLSGQWSYGGKSCRSAGLSPSDVQQVNDQDDQKVATAQKMIDFLSAGIGRDNASRFLNEHHMSLDKRQNPIMADQPLSTAIAKLGDAIVPVGAGCLLGPFSQPTEVSFATNIPANREGQGFVTVGLTKRSSVAPSEISNFSLEPASVHANYANYHLPTHR